MRNKNTWLILAASVVMAFSFTSHTAAQEEATAANVRSEDITVSVSNGNWLDVRVYAVSSSHTVRLGTVSGLGKETFELPRTLQASSSELRLAVRPIGQRGVHYSMPILASPGDVIDFRVENHLALSNAVIR